jgi:hypothetical protein
MIGGEVSDRKCNGRRLEVATCASRWQQSGSGLGMFVRCGFLELPNAFIFPITIHMDVKLVH